MVVLVVRSSGCDCDRGLDVVATVLVIKVETVEFSFAGYSSCRCGDGGEVLGTARRDFGAPVASVVEHCEFVERVANVRIESVRVCSIIFYARTRRLVTACVLQLFSIRVYLEGSRGYPVAITLRWFSHLDSGPGRGRAAL